jgi:uncharacterized membrane protein YqjE
MKTYDNSIADTLKSVIQDAQDLVRGELALAKAELREEVARVRKGAIMGAAAAIAGLIGLVFLLTAAAWAIAAGFGWPAWAGFAIVAGVVIVAAVVLAFMTRRLFAGARPMPQTVETMKENMQWMAARRP